MVTKAQVGLTNIEDIRVNYTATISPTVNDDINSGYSVGSVWIDIIQDQAYVSVDSTSGVAVWKSITTKYYQIGDTGPAGGIVFYVTDGGAHGYEAANEMSSPNTTYKPAFINRSGGGDSPNKAG